MKQTDLPLWKKCGNYPCNHIGCNETADFIVGTNHHDYSHFCKEHIDEYDNDCMEIIPNIRVIAEESEAKA